jgi:hypothetical protein
LSTRALWDWLGAGALVSLLVCYGVAGQSLVIGSAAGGWVYGYVAVFTTQTLVIGAAAGALAAALLFGIRPETWRTDWPALLAWILLALGLQALMRSLTPFTFERLFASDGANAFYGVTQRFRAGAVLHDFDRVRMSWPLHAQSNMPGKLMLVYALRNLSRDPAVLAWLAVLVSNLGAALMYWFTRALFIDRRIAMYSAVLYLLIPAKLYFFPLMNSVTPVVVLACAVLVLKWLRTGNAGYAAALGASLFVLVFFEPLPLVIGLLFALLVLRAWWLGQVTSRQLLTHMGIGVATSVATYGAVRLLTGFDLISALGQIGQHAVRFNAEAGRPYSIWVWANLREFLFGAGVCQTVLFGAALMDGLRGADSWRDRLARPITALCIGTAAVLLATDAIGVNRGEVIRLWIFLGCFFQIPAAYVCARLDSRAALMLVLAVTILQATLGTAMIGFIVPG